MKRPLENRLALIKDYGYRDACRTYRRMTGGRFTLVGTDLVRAPVGRARIDIPKEKITEFCRTHHIRKLALFGSVLRDDFRSDSDVDVLVEFFPGHIPGFLKIAEMERELSSLLGGRTVEIRTPGDLSRYFRDEVMESAETLYAQE